MPLISSRNMIKNEPGGIKERLLDTFLEAGFPLDVMGYITEDSGGNRIYTEVGFLDSSDVVYLKVGDMLLLDSRLEGLMGKGLKQNALDKIVFIHEFRAVLNDPKNLQYTIAGLVAINYLDIKGKVVLDLGCAEGVLGLVAIKKGCAQVFGVDWNKKTQDYFNINRKINGIEESRLSFISADFKNRHLILSSIPKDKIEVVFANIGPHYGPSDLDAFSLIQYLPKVKLVMGGGYSLNIPFLGLKRALFKLGKFGFIKNLKFFSKQGFYLAFVIERLS